MEIPDDEDSFVFSPLVEQMFLNYNCQDFPPPMPKTQPQDWVKRRKMKRRKAW